MLGYGGSRPGFAGRGARVRSGPRAEMHFMPEEFIELPDDRVLVLLRVKFRARQSGIVLEARGGHLVTIRDGLVTRSQQYMDQQQAREAAGLQTD